MVKLIIEDDESKTTVVPLIRDEITIGRKEGNTIRLTERNVSRRHAKLIKQNGGAIFIEDLNSYNGIKVNGNRISGRVAITEGDRIQIGDYMLGLKMEGAEQTADAYQPGQTINLPRSQQEVASTSSTPDAPPAEEADTEVAAPPVDAESVGRLVCLSNNFPGKEWGLDKPIMVIGRTEDNDIVVNHRSISRHHSRITEENGRYTIVDMQSSNGVRVNGEEYGKVELRRGDLIDLGHVRLRFVAPGEDFVFSRDASVVDISKSGRSRGGIYAGVVVVALVAVVGIVFWRLTRTDGQGKTSDIRSPAADAQAGTGATVGPDPAVLLAKISQAVGSEQWSQAIESCDTLTGEAKVNAEANCDKARLEKGAAEHFEAARKASLQNRYLEVLQSYGQIPDQSVYKNRDPQMVQGARTKYLAQAMKSLEDAVRDNTCDQAKAVVQQIKQIEPTNTEAEQKAGTCGAVAVAPRNPRPKVHQPRPKKPPIKPIPVVPNPPTLVAMEQVKALLTQAQDAYIRNKHKLASQLAQKVLGMMPGNLSALQILGASGCYLKNQTQALQAYNKLPPARRNLLKSICMRIGINLP